jgi:hypothetical protein
MLRSESIGKISSAFVKAQAEMSNAIKDSKNPFYKSSYADLNSVREACMPALNKHGIAVIQPTSVIEGKLYVETTLLHESGEFIAGLYEVVVGKQNDPQALGAAISYSRRYGLQSMVNVGASDDDGESAMVRSANANKTTSIPAATKAEVIVKKIVNSEPSAVVAPRGSFRRNPPVTTSNSEDL